MKTTLFFLLINFIGYAQVQTFFDQKSFGTNGLLTQPALTKLSDGNFILACGSYAGIAGDKTSPSNGAGDLWIIKINPNYQILWQKSFGGTGIDGSSSVLETPEGDLIFGGSSESPVSGNLTSGNNGGFDYWVLKLNQDGDVIWQNNYGGLANEQLVAISMISPNRYVLAGNSFSNISGDKSENSYGSKDYWIIMIDSSGSVIWDKTIGGNDNENIYDIAYISSSNKIIVSGISDSDVSGNKTVVNYGSNDAWLVELDLNGNILNQKSIGGSNYDLLAKIKISPQNEIYLIGASNSPISGSKTAALIGGFDFWLIKLDDNLNVLEERTFGGLGEDGAVDLLFCDDSQILLYGSSNSTISGNKTENPRGSQDMWMISIDINGNVNWDKTIGGSQTDVALKIYEQSDNTYQILAISESGISGDKTSYNAGDNHFWLLKLSTTLGIDLVDEDGFRVYPNPADDILNIEMSSISNQAIQIIDLTGKVVSEINEQSLVIEQDISFLKNGMYNLVFDQNGRKISKRFVVQR